MNQQNMIERHDRIVVGVSGGADSMCLLNVLLELREEYELSLFVVHINHCLRGEEADKEEEFVDKFCREKGVEVHIIRSNVKEYAKERDISIEEAGRMLRYRAFDEECIRKNAHKIAIAHNKNDNAETVLFHLFRGSGVKGMSGIPPTRGAIIRPLLDTTREEIEEWIREKGILYCTDSSNLTFDYTRNKIRHSILPFAQEQINDKSVEHIAMFAQQMRYISDYMNKCYKKEYQLARQQTELGVELSIEKLLMLEPIICQGVIKLAIEEVCQIKKDMEQVHVLDVMGLLYKQTGKQVHLPYHIIAKRGYTTLSVERILVKDQRQKSELEIKIPGKLEITEQSLTFEFELLCKKKSGDMPKNNYTKWFDYDKIRDAVVVRTRRTGDFLQIHRDGGNKSLKSLFIDLKIPQEKREDMYLLASGSHILWIPGVRTSEAFLVDENTTTVLSVNIR